MSATGLEVAVDGGSLAAWRLRAGAADDYDDAGTAASVAGPVVAIHGVTATSRAWLAVSGALEDRAELVAVDLRGRGASRPLGPPYGLDAHVADLLALLDALGLERAVLAGHSLGAFVACRLAVAHPGRVSRLVLVDGGLPLPEAGAEDPDAAFGASLGPALARLEAEFADRAAYRAWWRAHPAFADSDVDPELLDAFADYDLCGEAPQLRSSVAAEVVGVDGRDALAARDAAALACETVLLHAPKGFVDDPHPLQPPAEVEAWATAAEGRRGVLVPGANHYSILMGAAGARVVADEIVAALADADDGPALA